MPKSTSTKKAAKKAAKKVIKKAAKKTVKKSANRSAKKQAVRQTKKTQPKKTGKRFLIIYHVPPEAMEQIANDSPEQQAAGMALWKAWAQKVSDNLADLGAPLMNGKSVNAKGLTKPSNKQVSGYSLLDAEDWEEVLSLVQGNPHISGWHPDATIEIHETMLIPGM
jgi:hypothetical protein